MSSKYYHFVATTSKEITHIYKILYTPCICVHVGIRKHFHVRSKKRKINANVVDTFPSILNHGQYQEQSSLSLAQYHQDNISMSVHRNSICYKLSQQTQQLSSAASFPLTELEQRRGLEHVNPDKTSVRMAIFAWS